MKSRYAPSSTAISRTVILAKYMRVLTPSFVEAYPRKLINVHHSFLPAFIGAAHYRQTFDRGVKLIGATAHFVTDDLDEVPSSSRTSSTSTTPSPPTTPQPLQPFDAGLRAYCGAPPRLCGSRLPGFLFVQLRLLQVGI